MIQAFGSCNTKVSEILLKEDRAVFSAIQDGLDKANEHATFRAQMVGIPVLYQAELPLIKNQYLHLHDMCVHTSRMVIFTYWR